MHFSVLRRLSLAYISQRTLSRVITTPIFYANAAPHIGHLHTVTIADAAHRWNKLKMSSDAQLKFSTGTDEHGSKIAKSAAVAGLSPQQFCDKVSKVFLDLFNTFDISYTDLIRTTEDRHKLVVQDVWKRLVTAGFLYKDKYSGWYSVVDECFYTEGDVESVSIDGKSVKVVKGTKTVVEWVEEENYMFNLGAFRDHTKKYLMENDVIYPEHYRSLAIKALETEDALSVSRDRKRLQWGIPVPGDESQTIYVWLDALVNYLTINGFPANQNPELSCQIIGKDIIKFHTVYWMAFLKAIGLPMPKKIFVHGHWLVDGVKMSKSLGNVVDPLQLKNVLSTDGLRYFLLKQGVPTDDCNFTLKKAVEVVNSDLVNTLGNLLSRSTVAKLNRHQIYVLFQMEVLSKELQALAEEIITDLNALKDEVSGHFDDMLYYRGIECILAVVRKTNAFMQVAAPWKMEEGNELSSILCLCYETVRVSASLLKPIVPNFSQHALERLGVSEEWSTLERARFMGDSSEAYRRMFGDDNGPFLNRIQMKDVESMMPSMPKNTQKPKKEKKSKENKNQ